MGDGVNLPSKKSAEPLVQLPKELQQALQNIQNKDARERAASIFVQHIRTWGGPLPAPKALKEYEVILPGLAERIVKMAENQGTHRISLESSVVKSQLTQSGRGQLLGFAISIICLIATVWLALNNHDTVAAIVGGTTLVGLVTVFVLGKKEQKSDLNRKA